MCGVAVICSQYRTAGILLACTLVLTLRLNAQTLPDTLVWERVGTIYDVDGLFFDADTLYVAPVSDPFQVLRPGDEDFAPAFPPSRAGGKDLLITPERTVFGLSSVGAQGAFLSLDWGKTWLDAKYDQSSFVEAFTLPVVTPEGALLLGTRGSASDGGRLAARSSDGGLTWTARGLGDGTDGLGTTHLVVLPPSDSVPQGRIVATGFGGIAYSDDDGRSWQPTALYGGLAYGAWSSTRIAHGAYAGRLLAVVERGAPGGSPTGLYQSTDGITWVRLSDIPGEAAFGVRLLAAPDGVVYAYEGRIEAQPLWRSVDGGASWVNLGPVWTEWPALVEDVAVGPEGRLWAACSGGGFSGYDGGVFRTVDPVVRVSREEVPVLPGKPLIEWSLYPNPSAGASTVTLTLAAATTVEVTVYDVLGRKVASLSEGRLSAGMHRLSVDVSTLPAGLYLVRATVDDRQVSTRGMTVVR
jgi:hypothetical protein